VFRLSDLQLVPHISDADFREQIEKEVLSQEQLDEKLKSGEAQPLKYGIASVVYHEGDKSITIDNILVTIYHQAVSYNLPINAGFTNAGTQQVLQNYIVSELVRRYNVIVDSDKSASVEAEVLS
jgi:hypothetical protein